MILDNCEIQEQIDGVSEIAAYLWDKGWAERNAGNISIDLTGLTNVDLYRNTDKPYIEMTLPAEAASMIFFVTGTGKHLRLLKQYPEQAACILIIDEKAKGYHLIWGGEGDKNFRPTVEFVSHLRIHLYNREKGNHNRCVVHTHPIELIAISHHPVLGSNEAKLNKALWSMLPEIKIYVPKGIAIVPYLLPGSSKLANATVNRLNDRNVVLWSKHGALATGKNAVEAFDYIDVANKGAIIYLKCMQAGFIPEGLSDGEMEGLRYL